MSLNDFVIMEKLGAGSFASVYKVRRLNDQQIYALKKIDMRALGSKQKNNALNQIRLLAGLSSPYIIGYCQAFYQQRFDLLCIAMQYADGGDLYKLILKHKNQRSFVQEIQIWKILIHLIYGLNELHSKNILHRDLKSENVFIANNTYKIGDMNVSKIIKNGLAQTQTGTPYYASPEVWNDRPYNQKSDIWSLGCILYELTSLRPPFQANTMDRLFDNVNKAPTPKISKHYSRQLQSIIDQCLQKSPELRPSAQQLLQNFAVKIYQNLLIQFKPLGENNDKSPFLKTIYMTSKKQLKGKLPQANYKSSNNKEAKLIKNEIKQEEVKILKVKNSKQKQDTLENKSKDKLLACQNNQKKSSSKKRNRIQSCRLFKEVKQSSSKKKVSNKQNLFERVDFILGSIKQSNKKNQHQIIYPYIQKQSKSFNGKVNSEAAFQKQIQKIIINETTKEQIELYQLKPKKLQFDISPLKIFTPQKQSQKVQNIRSQQQSKQIGQLVQKILSKQPYLETMKNLSQISQNNHQQYNFGLEKRVQQKNQCKVAIQNDEAKYILKDSENHGTQPTIILKSQQKQQNDINTKYQDCEIQFNLIESHLQKNTTQIAQKQNVEVCENKINVKIDVYQNHISQNIINFNYLKQQKKINFILGFQKINGFLKKLLFKCKIFGWNGIKYEFQKIQLQNKQEQTIIKNYLQSQKNIKGSSKSRQKETIETKSLKKTEQIKKTRSKSIPKTEKINYSNKNTKSGIKCEYEQSISKHQQTKVTSKQKKQRQLKRQISRKKIFQNNSNLVQNIDDKYKRLKQLALIPSHINSDNGKSTKNILKEKNYNYGISNTQKPRKQISKEQNISCKQNFSNQKSIALKPIFNQGQNNFEQKRKRIFNLDKYSANRDQKSKQLISKNMIHQVSSKIDKMNLEKKIRKYINV